MLQIEYSVPRRLTLFIAMDAEHVHSEFIAFDFYSALMSGHLNWGTKMWDEQKQPTYIESS